jgi:hypothetical protein
MDIDWNKFLIDFLNAAMPVLVPLIITLIGAGIGLLIQYIRLIGEKIKNEKPSTYDMLEKFSVNAVLIAEQLKLSGFIENKKDWAINYVQSELNKLKIVLDVENISNMIEKALFEKINRYEEK